MLIINPSIISLYSNVDVENTSETMDGGTTSTSTVAPLSDALTTKKKAPTADSPTKSNSHNPSGSPNSNNKTRSRGMTASNYSKVADSLHNKTDLDVYCKLTLLCVLCMPIVVVVYLYLTTSIIIMCL